MLTRYAMFAGEVKAGKQQAMQNYVNEVLAPLWRQFTGAHSVRVQFAVEQDDNGPNIPLVLAISYSDKVAMQTALASPARYQSRDLLPEFYDTYFSEVSLYHYLFEHAEPLG